MSSDEGKKRRLLKVEVEVVVRVRSNWAVVFARYRVSPASFLLFSLSLFLSLSLSLPFSLSSKLVSDGIVGVCVAFVLATTVATAGCADG